MFLHCQKLSITVHCSLEHVNWLKYRQCEKQFEMIENIAYFEFESPSMFFHGFVRFLTSMSFQRKKLTKMHIYRASSNSIYPYRMLATIHAILTLFAAARNSSAVFNSNQDLRFFNHKFLLPTPIFLLFLYVLYTDDRVTAICGLTSIICGLY